MTKSRMQITWKQTFCGFFERLWSFSNHLHWWNSFIRLYQSTLIYSKYSPVMKCKRIKLVAAWNMTRTVNTPSKKLGCFKKEKSVHADYWNVKKSWMISPIMTDFFCAWDKKLAEKVVLIMGNCATRLAGLTFKDTKISFFFCFF